MKKILLLCVTLFSGAVASVFAECTGHSTAIDFEYKDSKAWTEGYNYSFTTTADGVLIEFEVLDKFDGMASPMLFDKSNFETLKEYEMKLSGSKASYTLKGYSEGDVINVLMKMPVDGGQLFTSRIGYQVGSDCSEWDKACGGSSTASDPEYSGADPASKPWVNGYEYSFVTTDAGVLVKFNILDRFDGMANPDLFIFDTTDPGKPLKGDPQKMSMYGVGGLYLLDGVSKGEEVEVMMKMPIAGGVLWTERHSYIVGTDCSTAVSPTQTDVKEIYPNPTKGVVYFSAESTIKLIEIYSTSGSLLRTSTPLAINTQIDFSYFEQGTYLVKVYTENGVFSSSIIKQ